ncbi:MAG TPA: TnsA endonuclease N-terminal domain-containing protein [Allosphingosinicella sp.]|jgi:hypothetical protein
MPRGKVRWSEEEIARRYAQGRGQGDLADYHPWLDFYDLSSTGLAARLPSAKTGRLHHLMSGIEIGAFLELIHSPGVIDIQEQYALDREDTRAIAAELGIRHPVYPGTKVDVVMTTDLVVLRLEGDVVRRYARAVKPASKLEDLRILEKLEIERRFWALRDEDWAIITDQEQSQRRRASLEWMHAKEVLHEESEPDHWTTRIAAFVAAVRSARQGATFEDLERALLARGLFQPDEMVTVIRHLCGTGRMQSDPDQGFDITWPVTRMPLVELSRWAEAA